MDDARKRAGVASRESKGKNKSIDDQDRENLEACEEQGWSVVALYRDGVSASRFGTRVRKNWNRLIADVSAGKLDIVVVWEVSRGDRDLETWVPFVAKCRELGVLVHVTSHGTTYDPRNRRHWRTLIDEGVDAADEVEKISERALKGIRGAVLEGKAHGPTAYGLTRVYDQRDRKKFTEVPNEWAPVVVEIIERVAKEDPIIAIERDLNARAIPGPFGGRWGRWAVRKIASNPVYIGMRSHLGVHHPGNWEPLVPLSTWQEAQRVLGDPKRVTTAPGAFKWLLSYLVSTPCGSTVHAVPAKDGRKPRYHCLDDGCTSVGVWEMDEYVTRVLTAWFARKGARALFERTDADAAAAREELRRLNDELEEWRKSADEPGGVSAIALARKERALLPLIEAAQKRIVAASTPAAAMKLLDAAEVDKKLIRPAWDGLSLAAKRSVIAALMDEIKVGPADERLSRWSRDEDRLRLAAERTTVTWIRVVPIG